MPKWLVKLMDKKLIESEAVVTADVMEIHDGALVFSDWAYLHSGQRHKESKEAFNKDLWISARPTEEE